ncbi:MAG: LysR substrate-binding domain-containing protein [Rhodoglobus sp.]
MAAPVPFVVGFVAGVTPGKWARVWGERRRRHPLELRPLAQAQAIAALAAGELDAAFLRLPVADESLSTIPLYEEQPVVLAPKDHPIAAFESLALADLAGETQLEGDWDETIPLVAANVGVVIVPQAVARAHSRRDLVARPVTDAPATRVALAWPIARTSPEVEEFIGIVRGRTANSSRGPQPPRPERSRRR